MPTIQTVQVSLKCAITRGKILNPLEWLGFLQELLIKWVQIQVINTICKRPPDVPQCFKWEVSAKKVWQKFTRLCLQGKKNQKTCTPITSSEAWWRVHRTNNQLWSMVVCALWFGDWTSCSHSRNKTQNHIKKTFLQGYFKIAVHPPKNVQKMQQNCQKQKKLSGLQRTKLFSNG